MFNGKIHYKWPFSIAMLVHQRVMHLVLKSWRFSEQREQGNQIMQPGLSKELRNELVSFMEAAGRWV